MEEQKLFIEDESNDRKYFTIVPNYILNHSTAIDQALYLQMKRIAGEKGICFASQIYLMKQLGVGYKILTKSLKYLLEHKWITHSGYKRVKTEGGLQKIKTYKINDLWKLNIEFYEGCAESKPLAPRVCQKEGEGCAESNTKKNQENKNQGEATPSVAGVSEVINLFREINPSYERLFGNKTERAAIERLISKYGVEKVSGMISALPRLLGEKGCPQITTPYQLERKLGQLVIFFKQNQKGRGVVFIN